MTHDIETRDAIIADLSDRLDMAETEVEQLHESLAQAKGEIGRLISVSKYEERETAEATAEVEKLKDVLRIKGYRESCPIPGCNCGEHGWIHGGYADDRLREICDELDEDFQGKTPLEAVIALKSHTWQQERAAVVAKLNRLVDSYRHVVDVDPWEVAETIRDSIEDGEHWSEGGEKDGIR